MRTDAAPTIRLEDYRPTDYLIDTVDLDVRLDPTRTRVISELGVRPNPAGRVGAPLALDGDELTLVSIALDGLALSPNAYEASPGGLTLISPPRAAVPPDDRDALDPTANTKLMGLYRSSGVYCTQCEAEGFRRITYFLDRPDVMSVYTTRIEADAQDAPVLLGNGNPGETGEASDGRHFAVWRDPHPKPAYLFALVGGKLGRVGGEFVTRSGRRVELGVYVEPGKESRAGYAMDALIRSMRWDEEAFGCEYDLDVFNIVAVSDFNMGAMENKGLNIFNDKYVLASSRDGHGRRLRRHRGDHRARVLPQLDRQQDHLPRLVPALPQGGADGLPRPGVQLRPALPPGEAHRRRAGPAGAAIRRGCRAPRPPGPALGLSRDQQLLHGDRLREGRGARSACSRR